MEYIVIFVSYIQVSNNCSCFATSQQLTTVSKLRLFLKHKNASHCLLDLLKNSCIVESGVLHKWRNALLTMKAHSHQARLRSSTSVDARLRTSTRATRVVWRT